MPIPKLALAATVAINRNDDDVIDGWYVPKNVMMMMLTIPKLGLAATVASNSAHPIVSCKATLPLPILYMHDDHNVVYCYKYTPSLCYLGAETGYRVGTPYSRM